MKDLTFVYNDVNDEAQGINIIKFENITIRWLDENLFLCNCVEIKMRVERRCVRHGNLLSVYTLTANSTANNSTEAVRRCIENVLQYRFSEFEVNVVSVSCCVPKVWKTVYDFTDITDKNWREMFETVFNGANWQIQKELT
jgi:hypothetical protein